MITVMIDGKAIEVEDGTTVLRAAQNAGIQIPTLCDHKELAPYGGCRLCLVEIEGMRALQPSCTLPVAPNMVVHTDTIRVKEARKFVLSLIFSERNHFCMYCQDSGGDCDLQNQAYGVEMTHWPMQPNFTKFSVDASHPYLVIDHNRCILCRRCVRACGELVGNFTLGIEDRGSSSMLIADTGVPLGESSCISCGTCLQLCPTGAIYDRSSAYRGRAAQMTHTASICTRCDIGCGIDVVHRDGILARIDGDYSSDVNHGLLCEKGRFIPLREQRVRTRTPLIRKNGTMVATTYVEALDAASVLLNTGQAASLVSADLPAEILFGFKQIFTGGTKQHQISTLPSTSGYKSLGKLHASAFEDIRTADCIVVWGEDFSVEHQVMGFWVKRSLPNGTRLLVIDTQKSVLSAQADEIFDPTPGFQAVTSWLQASPLIENASRISFILGSRCQMESEMENTLAVLQSTLLAKEKQVNFIHLNARSNSGIASMYELDQPILWDTVSSVWLLPGEEIADLAFLNNCKQTPALVWIAPYSSEISDRADIVIPVPNWAEMDGHFMNTEGTIQESHRILEKPQEVLSYQRLLYQLAALVGVQLNPAWKASLDTEPAVPSTIGETSR